MVTVECVRPHDIRRRVHTQIIVGPCTFRHLHKWSSCSSLFKEPHNVQTETMRLFLRADLTAECVKAEQRLTVQKSGARRLFGVEKFKFLSSSWRPQNAPCLRQAHLLLELVLQNREEEVRNRTNGS